MIDADLARLYGVATKHLNEQVRRNRDRFPADFMFQLTAAEKAEVVANCDHLRALKFSKALPHVFTEHGAVMLASARETLSLLRKSLRWRCHCEAPGPPEAGRATKQSRCAGETASPKPSLCSGSGQGRSLRSLLAVTVTFMARGVMRLMWIARSGRRPRPTVIARRRGRRPCRRSNLPHPCSPARPRPPPPRGPKARCGGGMGRGVADRGSRSLVSPFPTALATLQATARTGGIAREGGRVARRGLQPHRPKLRLAGGGWVKRRHDAEWCSRNVFAALLRTVCSCSLGQIIHALYEVGGQYRRSM